jgi:hypothetical protein
MYQLTKYYLNLRHGLRCFVHGKYYPQQLNRLGLDATISNLVSQQKIFFSILISRQYQSHYSAALGSRLERNTFSLCLE